MIHYYVFRDFDFVLRLGAGDLAFFLLPRFGASELTAATASVTETRPKPYLGCQNP